MTLKTHWMLLVAGGSVLAWCAIATAAAAPATVIWSRQLGTPADDYSCGLAADASGNIYIGGDTYGTLDGSNAGGSDAFLGKYDGAGGLSWTRQLGTSGYEAGDSVSAGPSGNVYITGWTSGDLDGSSAGGDDAFLSKYDGAGGSLWTRQLGTPERDWSHGVTADGSGNVYISGWTEGNLDGTSAGSEDAFLSKYDGAGNLDWTRQLGTPADDVSYAVAADTSGNVYISGETYGDLDGPSAGDADAFLSKYSAGGNPVWTRQLGTPADEVSYGVAADSYGNIYISGQTRGSLAGPSAGGDDAFLSKYDGAGNLVWTRQLGTSGEDRSLGVAVDAAGNIYISGYTYGSLAEANAGDCDAFLSKYDGGGGLLWTRQLGTSAWEVSDGVAVDASGNVYISGVTEGSLGGPNAGWGDAFLVKLSESVTIPGDANLDGIVDLEDFFILKHHFAQDPSIWQQGNFNDDTIIDIEDFFILKAHFGQHAPEPATALLLCGTGVAVLLKRRRKS